LIQTPDNQDILIDGGPSDKIIRELDEYMPFWDRDIELMILTHPHNDHIGGLIEVLKRYKVKKVLGYQLDYHSSLYKEWLKLIKERNIPLRITKIGDKFVLGNSLNLETLYPFTDITGQYFEDVNKASIINRLCYFEKCFLFTGDMPEILEEKLLENGIKVGAEVLKIGHHGSKYSSSKEFLRKVNPEYAVIQCGKGNKFDHPHYLTLKKLKELKVNIFRNDLDGDIVCKTNGKDLNCFKK